MNKIIKRVVSAVTAVAIALTAVFVFDVPEMVASASVVASGTCGATGSNLTWSLDSNGTLTVSGTGKMADYGSFTASPWKTYKDQITSVIISEGVTSIGKYAFWQNDKISSLLILEGVTLIDECSFQYCYALETVTFPATLTEIESQAFHCCNALKNVYFKNPNVLDYLGVESFVTYSSGSAAPIPCTMYAPCGSTSKYETQFKNRGDKYNYVFQPLHVATTRVAAKAATCTAAGNIEYWKCKCGSKKFSDAAGTTEVNSVTTEKLGHAWSSAWSKDAGYHWKVCTRSGCTATDTKIAHKWDSGAVTKWETCTETGSKNFSCTDCGQVKTETITATDHNWSTTWTTDADQHWHTCTNTDKNTNTKCTVTDTKENHSWDDGKVTKAATCKATGVRTYTCTVCQRTKTETIPMLAHTVVTDPAVAATCTATGLTAGSHCSVCGTITKAQETVTMLPHDWGEYQHNAEQHWQTCQNCVTENNREGHSWDNGTENKPATEYAEGEMLYTCTVCSQTKTEPITKLPHTHKWSDEWTYDENYHWHECTEADLHESEVHGDEIPHDWELSEVLKEATCAETGTEKYVCTVCGAEKEEVLPIDAEAHDWGSWTILLSPTLETEGTARRVCTRNSDHTDTVDLPVLTDTSVWTNSSHTDPTEDNEGEDVYTSEYGDVPVTLEKLPHTHEWGGWTITLAPTLETEGTAQRVCVKNNEHIQTETLPVLTDTSVWTKIEHTDPTEDSDGEDVYTSEYGEVPVILPALGHTHEWGNWTIIQAPTMETGGMAKHTCVKSPEHTETKALPALTDATVWTKNNDKHVDPTEDSDGRDVYTSEYGEVLVPLDKLPHTHDLTHIPEVPATETAEGVKEHWHCDGCGKDFEDENGTKELTADTIKIGKLEVEIQAPANVPQPEIATSKEELIAAALTEEEQKKVEEGTDIKLILKVEDASDSAPAEDKEKIDTAIGGLEGHVLGLYLDITLLKKIGEQEEKITRTNALITITFEVPSELHGKAEYTVVRVHDGEITVLSDKDSDPDTVTIETDRFSTYALTYQEKAAPPKPAGGGSHYSRPSTGVTYDDTSDETSDDTSDSTSDDTSDNTSSVTSDDMSTETSDVTSEDASSETSDDTSGETSDDTSGDISGDASDDMSGDISDDTSYSTSDSASGEDLGSGGSDHISDENSPSEDSGNPATGIAISLIPLAVTLSGVIVLVNRRKK